MFQLSMVGTNLLVCSAFGESVGFVDLLWIVAVVSLVQMLPVTIAGLGLREGAYLYLLQFQGVDGSRALAVSLAVFAIQLTFAFAGGLLQLRSSLGANRFVAGRDVRSSPSGRIRSSRQRASGGAAGSTCASRSHGPENPESTEETIMQNLDARGTNVDYDLAWSAWDDMKQFGPMSRHTRRLIWRMVAGLRFSSVLDVGCGQGSPLQDLARRRSDLELCGVDFSREAVELARRRMPDASFEVLDLTQAHLSRCFDLVVCTDVLEHIPDDRAALGHMRAMCGRWCLVASIQGQMRPSEVRVGHVRNYQRGELRSKMQEAGFEVVREIEWGWPLYSPFYRDLLEHLPAETTTGSYGVVRRTLAWGLYWLFMLNREDRGDYVFCLGRARA